MRYSTMLSRADFLHCLARYGPEAPAHWAQALGYAAQEPAAPAASEPRSGAAPGAQPAEPAPTPAAPPAERPSLHLPRIVHYTAQSSPPEQGEEPDWYLKARPWQEDDPALSANPALTPPPQLPLMPWPRLWPFLKLVLSLPQESTQPDVPPLVQSIARGEMPRRLPRRRAQRWASTCQVLLDFADALTPFWDDFHWLRQRLEPLRGVQGLTVLAFPEGDPEGQCLAWSPAQRCWLEQPGYTLPLAGTPVLVLSDLGCYDATGVRRRPWRRLGLRLRRAGCQPVALLPCPPRDWESEVTRLFAPLCWDRHTRQIRRPRPQQGQAAADRQQAREMAARPLLEALGAAVRIEPALLRAVRYLLPEADVGSEAAAWNHSHMHATPLAMYYEPEEVAVYRQAFADLEPALRQHVATLLRAYHAHLSPVISHEEHCLLAASGSAPPDESTATFLARLVHTLCVQEGAMCHAAQAWVERMTRRQYAASWQQERLGATWVAAHLGALQAGEALVLPAGLDIEKARWLLRATGTPRRYSVRQRGRTLCLETEAPPGALDAAGSLLGHISTARAFARVRYLDDAATEYLQPLQHPMLLPPGGALELGTEQHSLRIESLPRPAWASGMGQDRHGLFVTWEERQRQAYWVPPGVYAVTDRAGQVLGQRQINAGFWCDVAEALTLLQVGFQQPDWAEAYGLDAYGLYADWRLQDVTQRMRWIDPGWFMMGSPEKEVNRRDNETLHAVLLTRGFWLADTACTQALWEAVMQTNPSRAARGRDHPVDTVSWDDIQAFLRRLNTMASAGDVRLPTEAEWEYACRAGTATPFWFGEEITAEQVHYDHRRGGTVPVKALPCNSWGLYQMHGNVWEWCQDWYAEYRTTAEPSAADLQQTAEHAAVDPIGAAEGVYRVLRGGSWFNEGVLARSARRYFISPGYRFGSCGFRLARGQASAAGRAPEAPEGSGARQAGQTLRSSGGQARRAPRQRSKK